MQSNRKYYIEIPVSNMINIIKNIFIKAIKLYQYTLSPFFPKRCRFYPSCSSYCIKALEYYGLQKGMWLGLKRILRCHPWNLGGYDPAVCEKNENKNDSKIVEKLNF